MLEFAGRLLDMPRCGCHGSKSARVTFRAERIEDVRGVEEAGSDLLMPPLANGHDHVRAIRPSALGGFDLPLELWLTHMTNIPPVDPYLTASVALGRQVLGGVGSIMIHYTRPRDPARVADELVSVAQAACTIGVRVAVAVAMRDINPLGYGPDEALMEGLDPSDRQLIRDRLIRRPQPPAEQVRMVDDLAARIEGPLVTVQFGPYGMEWCSRELLAAIAERSATTQRRVHMHLLESQTQRTYLDHVYPQGPVRFLDEIGMLSPRLSVAHGVWLRSDEMELLAERGVTVAVNACSNLTLRSGVAPLPEMARRGVPLAMGMDGFSFDDDDDAFRELRLNYLLHRGSGLQDGISVSELLHMATYGARRSVTGIEAGEGLAAGAQGDLMVLDYQALASDVLVNVDEARIVALRGTSRHMKSLVVSGREIARDGRLTALDLGEVVTELDRQARHGVSDYRDWSQVSARLRGRLEQFYAAGLHTCA